VLKRAGMTLPELLVALSLGGIVVGVAAGSMLRQQRAVRWTEGLSGAELQLRPVLRLFADELSQLDASSGDIAAGQASDSSLEVRAVVSSSLTCDSAATVTLLPETTASPAMAGTARSPAPGDTIWLYRGATFGWRPSAVVAVARVTAGCGVPTSTPAPTFRLQLDAPADAGSGTPVRITRWERWVVYRASDGRWYAGIRDYSTATARFLAAQPIAGPFLRSTRAGSRTGFRYFDLAGNTLIPDGTNERSIARVRVTALSLVPSSTADSVRTDSADAVLSRAGAP
jgi:prepilin-type N-terminal cleavage/methylation domain-containing protein